MQYQLHLLLLNMGDSTALERPPGVSVDSAKQIASWLAAGIKELQIKKSWFPFMGASP
jgi:hypothetical protein